MYTKTQTKSKPNSSLEFRGKKDDKALFSIAIKNEDLCLSAHQRLQSIVAACRVLKRNWTFTSVAGIIYAGTCSDKVRKKNENSGTGYTRASRHL